MPNQQQERDQPHLGNKLREAIVAKGVRQVDVARHFGVKASTVSSDWLKHGRIAKDHYPKLVEYFGLPYEWWFGPAAADKKISGVMLAMLNMSEDDKNHVVRQCTADNQLRKATSVAPATKKKRAG